MNVDGAETRARWGRTEIPVTAGQHQIAVYFRYRGQRTARLGEGRGEFTVGDGSPERMRASAALGVRNGSSFRLAVD
ncbi:hypothetical protein ACFP1Z_32345 [Streptomyces gamaensis]|uniref:Uncharacterized protein n=1 Tax=Streptomyces gamaensis TaxID=1763542 RepID=A0ABW0ZBG9_9ACTN